MSDPFFITGPAMLSFSGGRSSGRLIKGVIDAHGGVLPDNHVVGAANTGMESEKTLRFMYDCSAHWGFHLYMVEWRPTLAEAQRIASVSDDPETIAWALENATDDGFAIVGLNSASRNGEPYDALIALKQRLPNGRERWCTQYLKVLALHALMRSLGYGEPGDYIEPIGLRADEEDRIWTGKERAEKAGRRVCYPLASAKISKREVEAFWWGEGRRFETSIQPQGFDLGLPPLWGNCTLCFAMGEKRLEERVRRDPSVTTWWEKQEAKVGGTFSKRYSVRDLVRRAALHKATPDIIGFDDDGDDSGCGDWCPGEAA